MIIINTKSKNVATQMSNLIYNRNNVIDYAYPIDVKNIIPISIFIPFDIRLIIG